jgi:hypothetical protein
MPWIVKYMHWIMLISGALTATMIQAAISPEGSIQAYFGAQVTDPAGQLVVRNWGILIGLMGAMLIYGAFSPSNRPLILLVAGTSKLAFIALVLSHGARNRTRAAIECVTPANLMMSPDTSDYETSDNE